MARHEAALPFLPGVHTTNGSSFNEILQYNKLRLKVCTYYQKPLLYLFYGKPAYRLQRGSNLSTRLSGDAAVCFVLNTTKLPDMHRAFALDTGASFGNRYDDYLPQGVSIDDFEIAANPVSVAKLVKAFFDENERYVNGSAKESIKFSPLDVVSDVYKAIASSTVSTFDDRACTCELQYDAELEINKDTIHTVVIPDMLFGETRIQKKMREWGVKPITYRFRRAKPEDRTEVICEKLGDYYEAEGFM